MKPRSTLLLFLSLFSLILLNLKGFSEGSKELYIGTRNTGLYCCNDAATKCNDGNGDRSQFATYDCNEEDRLFLITVAGSEKVFVGFNGSIQEDTNTFKLVFRIKDMSGNIVYPETKLWFNGSLTGTTGYIPDINTARNGPSQIYGPGGYPAFEWLPATPGKFYIEFNRMYKGGFESLGHFNVNLFDITIYDTISAVPKPGRLFSEAWQFQESNRCSAKTYVYSNDSIITSAEFNAMQGGVWIQFCNQWGCMNTGNFAEDRKSLYHPTTATYLPQFKIFLNSPDQTLFPPATTLGQVIPPVWGDRDCITGHILFHITVDKPGNVELLLTFPIPYLTRKLTVAVVVGENLLDWDGLDGTIPTGVPIPNNTPVTFSVSYINGLTNLPFFDVEQNPNGFSVGIVAPAGSPPLLYWDDSNIGGGTTNLTGCVSPGCHTWTGGFGGFGNLNTVNSWWYNVATSTTPASITEFRGPQALTFNQTPPISVCENSLGNFFSVNTDANADEYHWSYTPSTGVTIHQTSLADNSITIDFGPGATSGTLSVYGRNSNCSVNGPVSTLAITVIPLPLPAVSGPPDVCAGTTGNVYTTAAGNTNYTWTYSAGGIWTGGGSSFDNTITMTWATAGPQWVKVTYSTNGCAAASSAQADITVYPLPAATISGSATVCQNDASPLITFTGSLGSDPYTYTYNINGGMPQQIVSAGTSVTLPAPTNIPGTFTYTLTNVMDANTCSQNLSQSVTITVYPLPTASVNGTTAVCVNAPSPNIVFTGATGTPPYIFTYNINGGFNQVINTTVGNSISIPVSTATSGTFTYNLVSISDVHGCSQSQSGSATITVNPLPTATISGTVSVCQNDPQPAITFTGASASAPYTFFYNINGGAPLQVTSAGNTATVNAPTNVTGTFNYNLTGVRDASGTLCSQNQSGTATVTVKPLPTATISGTTSVCQFSPTVQITFTGASSTPPYTFTYNINGGANQQIISVGTTASITVSTNIVGTFNYNLVSVRDAGTPACSQLQSGTATVIVKPLPTPTISGPNAACVNTAGPVYTTEAGMLGYIWTITGGSITSGSTTNTVTVTWNATGPQTLSVNYTDPVTLCTAQAATSYPVLVNTLPTPTITGLNAICTGIPTNYTTEAGMSGYSWTISAGGTINFGNNTNTINVTWTTPGAKVVSVNYSLGSGCTALIPTPYGVTVNQSTPPTLSSSLNPVCESYTAVYSTQAGMTAYSWTISPGGLPILGGGTGDNTVTVQWNTPGAQSVSVNFTNQFGCIAPTPTLFNVTVNPLPITTITGPASVCQDYPTTYQYQTSVIETAAYTWSITGAGGTITPSNSANPININWTAPGAATLTVSAISSLGCPNTNSIPVTINPKPAVSMISCFDAVTTRNAKRFMLKGGSPPYLVTGSPLQGVYICTPATAALQADPSGIYYFDPSLAATNTYQITYKYTNQWGCPNTTTGPAVTITVLAATPACSASMTDPRDGKTYKTAMLAGKCWMTENLNYSKFNAVTAISTPMTDNCVAEKYCPPLDATCTTYGGFYQWDELIQYGNTDAPYQGACPPSWHVPTEAEWENLINFIDPVFTAPSAKALVGSELKDLAKSFKAMLEGINYLNSGTWTFTTGTTVTMFWTSTLDGTNRAIARGLNNPYNTSISRYSSSHANAFPVRCVKD